MDEHELRSLLDIASRIGEKHSLCAIRYANEIRIMRGAIWRALRLLRTGRVDQARDILQQQLARTEKK